MKIIIIYSTSCHSKPVWIISSVEQENFVHTVEIKGNQNGLVTLYKIFLLCSTEESNLERHEGEEMMTEFISCNFPAV